MEYYADMSYTYLIGRRSNHQVPVRDAAMLGATMSQGQTDDF